MKVKELKQLIREAIEEMSLKEMPRTPGTGGAYTITPEGEDVLRAIKNSGSNTAPQGLKIAYIPLLAFLYKAKQEGRRIQKIDYARSLNVNQPQVNYLFNELEQLGLVTRESYTPKTVGGGTGGPRQAPDIAALMGDLDI